MRELHRRAAAWLAQHDLTAEAVEHALRAEDFEQAAKLLRRLIPVMLTQGGMMTLRRWLDRLPPALLRSRPNLSIARAWTLVLLNRWDEVEPVFQDAEAALAQAPDPDDVWGRRHWGMVNTIRVVLSNNRGDTAQAIDYAQRALDLLPEGSLLQRSVVMRNLGWAYELQGRLSEASGALREAIALSRATDNMVTTLKALDDLARLEVEQAQLQRAAQLHRQALQAVETWGRKRQRPDLRLPNSGLAYLGLADIHREWNDLVAAREFAATALELGRQWHVRDTVQVAHVMLARILQAPRRS